jgi:hypothetical protein
VSDDSVGRYKRAYPRIWRHPGFLALSPNAQRIALYILIGPQQNRIGLAHFSIATAAEDVSLGVDTFRKGMSDVCVTFGWLFDAEARVLYIPSWWRWNRPENPNVLRGNLKDISELPTCGVVEAFANNLEYVPPDLQETFIGTLRTRLPERPPTQKQYQEHFQNQDQDQKPQSRRKAGFEKNGCAASTNQPRAEQPAANLVSLAKATLQLVSPKLPLEDLVDSFLGQHGRGIASRTEIERAFNATRLLA